MTVSAHATVSGLEENGLTIISCSKRSSEERSRCVTVHGKRAGRKELEREDHETKQEADHECQQDSVSEHMEMTAQGDMKESGTESK